MAYSYPHGKFLPLYHTALLLIPNIQIESDPGQLGTGSSRAHVNNSCHPDQADSIPGYVTSIQRFLRFQAQKILESDLDKEMFMLLVTM